jgi:putative ABC transport system substrate-binding protein
MRRRQFMAGLGSAAAWPVVAQAQQRAMPVIGYLGTQSADDDRTVPFVQGLKETGYVEGQNVAIEYRWADNQYDRLPALAADLVRRRVAVIVASGGPATLAARAATTTIPVVFLTGGDPVALGLAASLNRPGGNLTGTAVLSAELAPKRLQLIRELIPNAAVFGVLVDPAFPSIADLEAAARTLGLQQDPFPSTPEGAPTPALGERSGALSGLRPSFRYEQENGISLLLKWLIRNSAKS